MRVFIIWGQSPSTYLPLLITELQVPLWLDVIKSQGTFLWQIMKTESGWGFPSYKRQAQKVIHNLTMGFSYHFPFPWSFSIFSFVQHLLNQIPRWEFGGITPWSEKTDATALSSNAPKGGCHVIQHTQGVAPHVPCLFLPSPASSLKLRHPLINRKANIGRG